MSHDEHDHDHDHEHLPDAEERVGYYRTMETAVRELLIEKGIFTAEDVRAAVEAMDSRTPAQVARVVAKAWTDPDYRQRLLAGGTSACEELGIEMGPTKLVVVANTEKLHNLVVCTLCSCYPRMLLGLPPDWYKSRSYRSRAVREPRAVLAEDGPPLAADGEVRVHESTADMRYLVLPRRPEGTEAMSEDDLAKLVGRDAMIGVALPRSPA